MAYDGITNTDCVAKTNAKVVHKKRLHLFSCIFVCLIIFACYNISLLDSLGVSNFVKNITSKWTPKAEDIGKIKFVNFNFNNPSNPDGVFIVNSPFKNYYVTNINDTCLQVNGLGDMLVLAPISGIVKDIKLNDGKYDITINYGNVSAVIGGVSYATSTIGTSVNSGDKIGVCTDSIITFKLLCDGEYIPLHANGVGDTFFE